MALRTDILIVGAGPSGLMLACQLVKYGVDFVIIDKVREKFRSSGALVIHAASMEIFNQLGILQQILAEAMPVSEIKIEFNSKEKIVTGLSRMAVDELNYPPVILLEQYKLEEILIRFLEERNVRVRSMTLVSFRYIGYCIQADCMIDELQRETILIKYLVGADGKDSMVRKVSGFRFENRRDELPVFIMDFEGQTPVNENEMFFSFGNRLSYGAFPLSHNKYRLDGSIPGLRNHEGRMDYNLPAGMLAPAVTIHKLDWFSVFRSNYLLCDHFSADRVFLIGDAAHTHNPVGGQGMNSGFQDALNLSWKLAYVLKGYASPGILQTYTAERKPVVKRIMDISSLLYRIITSDHYFAAFARTRLAPLLLRLLMRLMKYRVVRNYIYNGISQLWIRYRGTLIAGNKKISPFTPGKLINPGKWGIDGISSVNYRLIIFSKSPGQQNYKELDSFPLEINEVALSGVNKTGKANDIREDTCILLRPDNYIAMVTEKPDINRIVRYFKGIKNEENTYRT